MRVQHLCMWSPCIVCTMHTKYKIQVYEYRDDTFKYDAFLAILHSHHSHSKASVVSFFSLTHFVIVVHKKKFASWHAYICAVLFIDRLVLWSQCMDDVYFFFNPHFSFVFLKHKSKSLTHVLCWAVFVFAPVHSVDQLSQIASLNVFVCWWSCCRCCCCCFYSLLSFFHTTLLFRQFFVAAQKCIHDLYKLNAVILLNVYACFSFYFLCIALIAFFSTFITFYFVVCVYS